MDGRCRRSQGLEAGSNGGTPALAPSLLDLPAALLEDITSRAMQLGAAAALAQTSSALLLRVLQHAPALRITLNSQLCDQPLSARLVSALHTRTSKLAMTLQLPKAQPSETIAEVLARAHANKLPLILQPAKSWDSAHLLRALTEVLANLGSCAAVEACKLSSSGAPCHEQILDCTPGLAHGLLHSFPGLTALSIHGYTVSCSGLASVLSHPQLALQLQRLDLTRTVILQPDQPGHGALTLFHGLKLKQLSLDIPLDLTIRLQPLAQHLTRLSIRQRVCISTLIAAVGSLPLLQVLSVYPGMRLSNGCSWPSWPQPQFSLTSIPHNA
ncbi:hypothetical protein V8C86DRAFT_2943316 [Haematococcus lacustris]